MNHQIGNSTRREILFRAGAGFGAIPLSWLLQSASAAEVENSPASAHRAKVPHRLGRAKSVIFLFMEGGPSHIDTFDPKPKLNEWAGVEAVRPERVVGQRLVASDGRVHRRHRGRAVVLDE